jgi:hypothetical protein
MNKGICISFLCGMVILGVSSLGADVSGEQNTCTCDYTLEKVKFPGATNTLYTLLKMNLMMVENIVHDMNGSVYYTSPNNSDKKDPNSSQYTGYDVNADDIRRQIADQFPPGRCEILMDIPAYMKTILQMIDSEDRRKIAEELFKKNNCKNSIGIQNLLYRTYPVDLKMVITVPIYVRQDMVLVLRALKIIVNEKIFRSPQLELKLTR